MKPEGNVPPTSLRGDSAGPIWGHESPNQYWHDLHVQTRLGQDNR